MIDIHSEYGRFFVAATLGAHSNFSTPGFRQKDVRFLLELFLNWNEGDIQNIDEQLHNTQILRYLEQLRTQGFLRKIGRRNLCRYTLTRPGILELVSQLTQMPQRKPCRHFPFIYFFVRSYGQRLRELIRQKENRLPKSFDIELRALLDTDVLLKQQTRALKIELQRIEQRIAENIQAIQLAEDLQTFPTETIAQTLEAQFPYNLNPSKPMSKLILEIPAEYRLWEMTEGNRSRVDLILKPIKLKLQAELKALEGFWSTSF